MGQGEEGTGRVGQGEEGKGGWVKLQHSKRSQYVNISVNECHAEVLYCYTYRYKCMYLYCWSNSTMAHMIRSGDISPYLVRSCDLLGQRIALVSSRWVEQDNEELWGGHQRIWYSGRQQQTECQRAGHRQ